MLKRAFTVSALPTVLLSWVHCRRSLAQSLHHESMPVWTLHQLLAVSVSGCISECMKQQLSSTMVARARSGHHLYC